MSEIIIPAEDIPPSSYDSVFQSEREVLPSALFDSARTEEPPKSRYATWPHASRLARMALIASGGSNEAFRARYAVLQNRVQRYAHQQDSLTRVRVRAINARNTAIYRGVRSRPE